jgi:SH3 domain-containing YSC84-like protein 1
LASEIQKQSTNSNAALLWQGNPISGSMPNWPLFFAYGRALALQRKKARRKEVTVIQYRDLSKKSMTLRIMAILCLVLAGNALADKKGESERERVRAAGYVMRDLLRSRSGVPTGILNRAECVIILPSTKKGAFIVGASYGRGVMTCRSGEEFDGPWSAPAMMRSGGGNFGLQVGAQFTDFVILVMNDRGARSLMRGKAKLGADVSVAAGPKGRLAEASTNGLMNAELLSYSRAQGVFGGVSLSGGSLRPDNGASEKLYGKKVNAVQIIEGGTVEPPPSANVLLKALTEASPRNESRHKK